MNYYPFHPGDYLRDTAHLDPLEDLAYRRLLDLYYLSEAPIPLETQLVSRRLRLGYESVISVLNEFFVCTENGYTHKRCDAVLADYKALQERARQNGKAGGRPKNEGTKPSGNPAGSQQEPSGNPAETEQKPARKLTKTKTKDSTSVGFTEFWQAYPNKTGKGAAEKSWQKQQPDLATVLAALAWQTKQDAWTKDQGNFIPHPATYLNQRRWEDEQPVTKPKAVGGLNL
jgi:uncharacterized protein YdaU (DUF1376 family)